ITLFRDFDLWAIYHTVHIPYLIGWRYLNWHSPRDTKGLIHVKGFGGVKERERRKVVDAFVSESLPKIHPVGLDGRELLNPRHACVVGPITHPSKVPHTACLTSKIGRTSTLGAQPLAACASQCSKFIVEES
ncbi:hypothetical protein K0M31_007796, partial [Melipona bicolor]